jgi:hypothetical protein
MDSMRRPQLLAILPALSLIALLMRTPGSADEPPSLKQALGDRAAAHWIYDDLAAGIAQARQHDKPLLVVFR